MDNPTKHNISNQITAGLQPTKPDKRDFQLGKIIKWPDLSELPKSFELPALSVKNQGSTDFCSSYMSCGMSELQEQVELNPEYSFALSKSISGNPQVWGQNLRTAMKAHLIGALEEREVPREIKNWDRNHIADIKNWPDFTEKAKEHRKQSYFKVAGYPSDWTPSDALKATIWLFRGLKRACGIGVVWSWSISDKRMTVWNPQGVGHAMFVRGWTEDGFLIVQNSYGKGAGDNGHHYMSPVVIDKAVQKYGAYTFVDVDPSDMKKKLWPWWVKVIEAIKKYIKDLFK